MGPVRIGQGLKAGKYDLIVIGGGSAAFAAVIKAADLGNTALMINSGLPTGGTCVNVGCMPTKHLLEIGDAYYYGHPQQSSPGAVSRPPLDFKAVLRRSHEMVVKARQAYYLRTVQSLKKVILLRARARFVGPGQVEAAGRIYEADKIIIATGATTRPLPIPGLDKVKWLTYISALELEKLPESLVVIGAGPTGLELAQMFAHFGSAVSVLEAKPQILPRHEPEIAEELEHALVSEGLKIYTGVKVLNVAEKGGQKSITIVKKGSSKTLKSEEILVAAGIRPNTTGLNLDTVGVELDPNGFIQVNQFYQTRNPEVFAAGDCIGKMALETVAGKEGAIAAQNALTSSTKTMDYDQVPNAVFTNPQAATVGLTEAEAKRRYGLCLSRTIHMDMIPKAMAVSETRGAFKMVIHPESNKILGVHIVAPNASEIIHEATVALRAGMTIHDIIETLHVFPTFSEGIKRTAQAFIRDISKMSCCIE